MVAWFLFIEKESSIKPSSLITNISAQEIASIDSISSLINKRHFGLQRVFWALDKNSVDKANEIWKDYYESVKDWNHELNSNKEKIRRLLGDKKATEFLDYTDELHPNTPTSIHGHFWLAHDNVLKLKECLEHKCDERKKLTAQAANSLTKLDLRSDEFIYQANVVIKRR